jgi:hypothetical protein
MAHCTIIFHHMLKLIPRDHFSRLAGEHGTGRPARTFSRWQRVHLIFMQVTSRESFRDGVAALKARSTNLYHLAVRPVARSTFADTNNRQPASFFAAIFARLYQRCLAHAPCHKFKFKNKLYSLDATVARLCLSLFPWASFRRTKAGGQAPHPFGHDGYLPAFVAITPAREHEVKKARALNLPKGSIVVEDLGYTDYAWYGQLTAQKIFFVTRLPRNVRYQVVQKNPVPADAALLADQTIRLTTVHSRGRNPKTMRLVHYRDPGTGKECVFPANLPDLAALAVVDLYR